VKKVLEQLGATAALEVAQFEVGVVDGQAGERRPVVSNRAHRPLCFHLAQEERDLSA
jgi:hypothetical protein